MKDIIEKLISELDGVEFVHMATNFSFEHDKKKDLPPISFKVYVKGGKKKEIAKVIWTHKSIMMLSVGNTQVTVKDDFGIKWRIDFERLL